MIYENHIRKGRMKDIMERRIPTAEEIEKGIERDADRFRNVFAALAGDEKAIEEMEKVCKDNNDNT